MSFFTHDAPGLGVHYLVEVLRAVQDLDPDPDPEPGSCSLELDSADVRRGSQGSLRSLKVCGFE